MSRGGRGGVEVPRRCYSAGGGVGAVGLGDAGRSGAGLTGAGVGASVEGPSSGASGAGASDAGASGAGASSGASGSGSWPRTVRASSMKPDATLVGIRTQLRVVSVRT
ncbi:MAG TPA: hypothetical protein DEF51_33150 [Myxococcales bacterium]|nr:hypothetical protein [Myxococcales bacterium]